MTVLASVDLQQTTTTTDSRRCVTPNWVKTPYKKRNFWQRIATIALASEKCYVVQPRNANLPPKMSVWGERLWLILNIAPALIIHALWYYIVPETNFFHSWHPFIAFVFYHISLIIFTLRLVKHLHYCMDYYGTFDEHNRPRDYVLDKDVIRLLVSVLVYTIARTAGGLFLGGYDRYASPSLGRTISWAFPIKIGLWLIVLDFFFYTYHRAVHTVPFLWKYHSKHHATKHPSPVQAILADDIQEIIEIFVVPLFASLVMPLTAHEFWIAQCILMYIEGMGHTGARAHWTHPLLGEFLQLFEMDLTIEDHDLHHRYGKSGRNYGKQTRMFDRLFNTIDERVEGIEK